MNICKCNNCDTFYEDTNPQIEAEDLPEIDVASLELIKDSEGYCHACPNCLTDGFLKDSKDFNETDWTGLNRLFAINGLNYIHSV